MDTQTEVLEKPETIETIEVKGNSKINHINRTENLILEICKKNPSAVKNDTVLYFEYLKLTGQIDMKMQGTEFLISIQKDKFPNLTKASAITRLRRDLHKNGKLVYDQETEQARENYEKGYHSHYTRDHSDDFENKEAEGIL